jgi:UDP-N-acetylmuramate dehydrogenase
MMAAEQKKTRPWRGELRLDEPMARHTSWRVGGPAARFFEPADSADLVDFLAALEPAEPLFWVGLGSNLLVRDGGLRGTVIHTTNRLAALDVMDDGGLRVEAGVPCAKVARAAARAGLGGAEFLAGIPGTLGGALAMNAGAFGGETWALVEAVETVDRYGVVRRRAPADYRIGYRAVEGPEGEWFLAAFLRLDPDPDGEANAAIRALLARRNASQPTSQPTAGSTFRNPEGDHAARLLEEVGMKGRCVGGACVSELHANFIINTGTATAADIEALMVEMAEAVHASHGVRLEPEVRIVGEAT